MNTTGRVVDGASTSLGAGTRRRLSAELGGVSAGFNSTSISTLEQLWAKLDTDLDASARASASTAPGTDAAPVAAAAGGVGGVEPPLNESSAVRDLVSGLAGACRSAAWASDAVSVTLLAEAKEEFEAGSKVSLRVREAELYLATCFNPIRKNGHSVT